MSFPLSILFKKQTLFFIVIAAAFLAFRSFFAYVTVDKEGAALLKKWISAECTLYHVNRTDVSLEKKAELLRQAEQVEFLSIKARGHASNMVVRVQIKPGPAVPPKTPEFSYFRMRYSVALGWRQVPQPASALTFFLALFLL